MLIIKLKEHHATMNDKDTLVLDVSAGGTPKCSICKNPLQDHPTDPDKLQCTSCFREYMPSTEMIESDDEMVSVHEDENIELGGIGRAVEGLVTENDDDLMQPHYKQNSLKVVLREGEQLRDYEETIPE